jgi:phosphohistidine phosphatase
MDLYFLRHGDAGPASAATPDEARRLTGRGRREAEAVARALHRAGLRPEAILTSPLARARQTGEIVQEVFGITPRADDRLGSGCGLGAIQSIVSERSEQRVLFVGHEPDLSTIVGRLIGSARVQMKKSGFAHVQVERVEPGQGLLVWLLTPQLFPAE